MKKFLALFAALFLATSVYAERAIPAWVDTWVVDQAGILTANQESQINAYCREIERKSSMQFGILTVDSLEGESIEHFAIRVFEKWKLGQAGKDNGCLFIISVDDRMYRIEVGYGLEGSLTDLKTGRIGRSVTEPKLAAGDWSGGTMATIKALYETASGESLETNEAYGDISSIEYSITEETPKKKDWRVTLIIIAIIVFLVILDVIFTGGEITMALLSSSSSGSSSHGSSHHYGGGGRSGGGGHSGHF